MRGDAAKLWAALDELLRLMETPRTRRASDAWLRAMHARDTLHPNRTPAPKHRSHK